MTHVQTADLIYQNEVVMISLLLLLTVALKSVCQNIYDRIRSKYSMQWPMLSDNPYN